MLYDYLLGEVLFQQSITYPLTLPLDIAIEGIAVFVKRLDHGY